MQPQALARVQGVHRPDEVRHWSLEIRQAVMNENLQIKDSFQSRHMTPGDDERRVFSTAKLRTPPTAMKHGDAPSVHASVSCTFRRAGGCAAALALACSGAAFAT